MMSGTSGNYFEHFKLGQVIHHATPRTITDGECALYIALTGARQPMHCATPVAQSLGYREKPVDDLLAFHIAFAKTVPDISVNAVANLGYADVRFLRPVYVGDTLNTISTVIGLKQNSNGQAGVVYVRSESRNQHSEVVLSWVRWVIVHKHDLDAPAPETVIPTLPDVVSPKQLAIPRFLQPTQLSSHTTGSARLWDDYRVGDRIDHPAGMTVDDSDHTLATKLYQNNARLHFDDLMMQDSAFGRRLMFGGHVISVCRALSYDGLENGLSIVAINGGTHCHPSFGGDTFYAVTEVLEKWELQQHHLGALRLRLLGLKNLHGSALADAKVDDNGKSAYHPNVVLDLDYTILMPRR